ncbi:MAG: cation:proton antiporter [Calditrichia bacterium]
MKRRLLLLLLAWAALMFIISRVPHPIEGGMVPLSLTVLGFTLITAYLLGKLINPFGFPKITGYILAGAVFGPFAVGLMNKEVVTNLNLIDNIALALIALTAGGEFEYNKIKPQIKTISAAILFQMVLVVSTFLIFITIYQPHIPFLKDQPIKAVLGAALLIGSIAAAKSPATTIAVISETRAKGVFTDFVLGVTVLKDIVVVLFFSLALAFAKPMIAGGEFNSGYIFIALKEIGASILLGGLSGVLLILYLKYVDLERTLFLLGFVLLGIEIAHMIHAEVVLIFMVAGFIVQNFSSYGHRLINTVSSSSLPIYVVFFAIAGASLDFSVFLENWQLALWIVVLRLLATYAGTYIGGKSTGAPKPVKHLSWMGFIDQAGLSLGLSSLVVLNIPGEMGINIRTLIIAVISINMMMGPVLFRIGLSKAGDIPRENGE